MQNAIYADIIFSVDTRGPDQSDASILQTVAALNPIASQEEFVVACVAAGYKYQTAVKRFRESRALDLDEYGAETDEDGRQIYIY